MNARVNATAIADSNSAKPAFGNSGVVVVALLVVKVVELCDEVVLVDVVVVLEVVLVVVAVLVGVDEVDVVVLFVVDVVVVVVDCESVI